MSLDSEVKRILVRTTQKLALRAARNDEYATSLVKGIELFVRDGRFPALMTDSSFENAFLEQAGLDLPWRIPFFCISPEKALRYLQQEGPERFATYMNAIRPQLITELQQYGRLLDQK